MEAWLTHETKVGGGIVTKRFRPGHYDGARRESLALQLLLEHAPGLAPRPLHEDLGAEPAEIAMEELNGQPLRGRELSEAHLLALASTLNRLMTAVPMDVLVGMELARSRPEHVLPRIQTSLDTGALPVSVVRAVNASQEWAAATRLSERTVDSPSVFGHGDGNLANYLYHNGRVQIVDLEDSGRSDRACELAEVVEHLGFWHEAGCKPGSLTGLFNLDDAERHRLLECRRMHASAWLRILIRDLLGGRQRNHPDVLGNQAARVLRLLARDSQ